MNNDRLSALFEQAMQADDQQLAALLESLPAGERSELERLLAVDADASERGLFQALHTPESRDSRSRGVPTIPDYKIIRELGRGAMGVVYEAEQISLARRVALKTTLYSTTNDKTHGLRFQHEARTAARLHHPNIVPIYDVGDSDDTLYYAMQFIDGCGLDRIARAAGDILQSPQSGYTSKEDSLASWLIASDDKPDGSETTRARRDTSVATATDPPNGQSNGGLSSSNSVSRIFSLKSDPSILHERSRYSNYYRSIAKIGQRVADAMSFAHENGVIHRDIKPSNLLLDTKGQVWVADFGLVKTEDHELTQTGAFVGTLRFMAPERFQGKCDPRSDVYSLGITLYELLALRPAYEATDQLKLLKRIRDVDPPPLRSVTRSMPRDLDVIVERAMHKDPRHRYESARDLADDLQCFLDGRPIQARQVGSTEKLWLWAKKHKALAVSLASILLLLVIGALAGGVAAIYFRNQGIKQKELTKEANSQRDAARQNAYYADMRFARQDWEDGQIRRMLTTLRQYVPGDGEHDLRGWEWYNLLSLPDQEVQTIWEDAATFQVDWTADGDRLITASRNGKLHVRETIGQSMGQSLRHFDIPDLRGFALGPDDERIATIGDDSTVSMWELSTGKRLKKIATDIQSIADIDWNPQGDAIGITSKDDCRLQILDLNSNQLQPVIASPKRELVFDSLEFSPDGKFLAVCNDDQAQILEVASRTWMQRNVVHHYNTTCFAWHPKSRQFVEGAANEGFLQYEIRDAPKAGEVGRSTDKHVGGVDNRTTPAAMSYSPTGKYLLASGNRVEVFDLKSNEVIQDCKGHIGATVDADWHPTKPLAVSCSLDGSIRFWDVSPPYPWTAAVASRKKIRNSTGLSRDGRWKWQRITPHDTSEQMTIIATDTRTGTEVGRVELPVTLALYTPIFFTGGNRILFVRAHQVYPEPRSLQDNPFADGLGFIRIYSIDPWEELEGWEPSISSVGNPNYAVGDNLFIVTDEQTGFIRILDFEKNIDFRLKAHEHGLCLRLNPDYSRLATCSRGKVSIWDTTTWKEVASYSASPDSEFRSVEWRNDGRYLVTGDSIGNAIIWDTMNHERLHTLRGHQSDVDILGFSSDNSRLITASQSVHVWDVPSGREILTYPRLNIDRTIDEFFIANERIRKMPDPQETFNALDRANAMNAIPHGEPAP